MTSQTVVNSVMTEEKPKKQMCDITSDGIILLGVNIPWVALILVAVLVYFYMNKESNLLSDISAPSKPSVSTESIITPPLQTGGLYPQGDVARMFRGW